MRHRPQDGGLDSLAAAQALRFNGLRGKALPVQRHPEQRRERRDHALAQPADHARRHGGRDHERSEAPVADRERDRQPPPIGLGLAQRDRRPGKLEHDRQPPADQCKRIIDAGASEQQLRDLGGEVRLGSAPLGLDGSNASPLADGARCDRRNEERGECDPVAAVGDRPATDRWEMEEVERGGAQATRSRGRATHPRTPTRSRLPTQVDDSQRRDRRDLLQRIDETGADGDERHGHQHPQCEPRAASAQ